MAVFSAAEAAPRSETYGHDSAIGTVWGDLSQAPQAGGIDHVIAMLSDRGGVGGSAIAALLALALRRQGQRVGLLDADITNPSIASMFGIRQPPSRQPAGILPARTITGIRIMSSSLLLHEKNPGLVWRGPLVSGAIRYLWQEALWGALDVMVIDLPPGTHDAALTVMQFLPVTGSVLVTSSQDRVGSLLKRVDQLVESTGVPLLGLVESVSCAICPQCGEQIEIPGPSEAAQLADELQVPFLGQLSLDRELALRCDLGQIEGYSAEPLGSMAETLADRLSEIGTRPHPTMTEMGG